LIWSSSSTPVALLVDAAECTIPGRNPPRQPPPYKVNIVSTQLLRRTNHRLPKIQILKFDLNDLTYRVPQITDILRATNSKLTQLPEPNKRPTRPRKSSFNLAKVQETTNMSSEKPATKDKLEGMYQGRV
jgi:hypothetical protein